MDSPWLPYYIIVTNVILPAIAIVLSILFARWIFKVNKIEAYQKVQSQLLLEIAKKLDCDKERLEKIVSELKAKIN